MAQNYNEELEKGYTSKTVMEEASRCLLCLDAPCSEACPAKTDPAKFIRSVRFRNFKGAAETVRENNALGAICARVCPTEKYCQKACSRTGIDKPIDIGGIQRFVTDFEDACGMEILKKGKPNGKKVVVVGSGPSGLQASASLARLGYEVVVLEKSKELGGYLRYGIPEYRLPNKIVDKEIEKIAKLGVTFKTGVEVGKDVTMEELKKDYDAVLVAIGASKGKMIDVFKGVDNVELAVDFLARVKSNKGKVELPNNVLVVGGGDVAMDVCTTLKLLGVANVTDVVYEEFKEFRASKKELEGAQKLGVSILDGYVPVSVDKDLVTFKHRVLNATLVIKASKIILATGQEVDASGVNLEIVRNEVTFEGHRTNDPKVFVAGDIAKGDKTVVAAVRKGKLAAIEIHKVLGGK